MHHEPLRPVVAVTVYGLVDVGDRYAATHSGEFPHHGLIGLGGCVPGRSAWTIVLQCERCRARELEWERDLATTGVPFRFDAAARSKLSAFWAAIEPPPSLDELPR
ncbi:MAG TPA: hypothetical protein VFY71_03815 [Planctomycetota bacterium]|nr:hypothetical protein [Planctomycetota bacterium]